MTNVKEHFVGIDVSKDRLDVAVWGEKRAMEAASTKKGMAELVKQICSWNPKQGS